jgi:hypothetical protein
VAAVIEIAKQNKNVVVMSPCSPLHAVSQVNKNKNTNEMILGANTEELNLFQMSEMLVPDYIDYSTCTLSMHGRVCLLCVTFKPLCRFQS